MLVSYQLAGQGSDGCRDGSCVNLALSLLLEPKLVPCGVHPTVTGSIGNLVKPMLSVISMCMLVAASIICMAHRH
jgi:hypothetical protein